MPWKEVIPWRNVKGWELTLPELCNPQCTCAISTVISWPNFPVLFLGSTLPDPDQPVYVHCGLFPCGLFMSGLLSSGNYFEDWVLLEFTSYSILVRCLCPDLFWIKFPFQFNLCLFVCCHCVQPLGMSATMLPCHVAPSLYFTSTSMFAYAACGTASTVQWLSWGEPRC